MGVQWLLITSGLELEGSVVLEGNNSFTSEASDNNDMESHWQIRSAYSGLLNQNHLEGWLQPRLLGPQSSDLIGLGGD